MSSKISPFTYVPRDILAKILEYTHDVDDLSNVCLVSKRWRDATNQACLSNLRAFNVHCIKTKTRKQVIATVHTLFSLFKSKCESPILAEIDACFSKPITSILDLHSLKKVFTQNNLNLLKFLLIKLDQKYPPATLLKTILINNHGNILISACYNNISSLRFHLSEATPAENEVQSCLLPACRKGNFKMVKLLIEHGADPKVKMESGVSESFLTAASKQNNFTLVKLLITKGAHTREKNSKGLTPLAIAARVNSEMFKLLADISASLSDRYNDGEQNTLAHFAALGNNPKVIRIMVSREAPIDLPNQFGVRPLMTAIRSGSLEAFFELLECGADIHSACNDCWTPLDYAVHSDQQACINFLLSQNLGRGVRLKSLKLAASYKNVDAIKKISYSLGITPAVKYGSALVAGAAIGVVAMKYFSNAPD